MNKELPKTYDISSEEEIYELWRTADVFKPRELDHYSGESFAISMPPPNSNGDLHAGHALFVALQDIMTRYHRMKGDKTVWIPGTDHAGFETQYVFEKKLEEEGKTRFEMDREEFYDQVYDFTIENQETIINQLQRLGASADWDQTKFTLDEDIVEIVYSTFKKLFDDGLIYRGKRLINYSFVYDSSLSDLEVERREQEGKLFHIHYHLKDEDDTIAVATTRPETLLGDTAIAVHPEDERFEDLVGKTAIVPLVDREVPIVADEDVDPEFGTGAVKVTPAHDHLDFEIGERHDLGLIQIIGFDGKVGGEEVPEKYQGMEIEEAREAVVGDVETEGLLEKIETITHNVAVDYKDGQPIEPLPMTQWFVEIDELAERATGAVENDDIEFVPEYLEKEFFHWMGKIRDWNISRQIWWGISIPAWYCLEEDAENLVVRAKKDGEWQVVEGTEYLENREDYDEDSLQLSRAKEMAEPIVTTGEEPEGGKTYLQESDTFDTWFSSGQWPYAVLGFNPLEDSQPDEFHDFYPNNVMETASDILFFWVTRMIMLGLYATDKVPFETVYFHGLVNDEKGQKMSKSRGNVVEPIGVAEEYGADALRMSLVIGNTPGTDQALSLEEVEGYRNFGNKIWNVGRFILMNMEGDEPEEIDVEELEEGSRELYEEWVDLRSEVTDLIDDFRFDLAADKLYHFAWDRFADEYLEYTKDKREDKWVRATLLNVYKEILQMLHPFMPFVTEKIWQEAEFGGLLAEEEWPEEGEE